MVRFAAAQVGVKHQPFLVIMLKQHDTLIRLTIFVHRGNHHGRWVGQFCFAGLF